MLQSPIKLETFRRISLEWFLPLVYLVGLVYVALLPELSQEYFVDENAFIVHSVQAASTINDVKDVLDLPGPTRVSGDIVQQWLAHAFKTPSISIRRFEDDTVYAILRSRRSNGDDSIVIVVPYYSSKGTASISGIHIATALIKYLNTTRWLAKDIILLCVPDNRRESVAKWVSAYHSDYSNGNESQNLPMERAGAIRAAIILDLPPSTTFQALSLVCQTARNVLPNFDMVAIIQYMLQQHNIPLVISDHYNSSLLSSSTNQFSFLERWRPMLRFVADTLSSPHSDLHAPFIDFNIDALSLNAVGASTEEPLRGTTYFSLIQAMEESIRSFSNLIEKLHHSSFLYILTSSTKVVTFLVYYWIAIIVALPWPLPVIHRLQNELPLSKMMPAFQSFSLLLLWSLSLCYGPVLLKTGFVWSLAFWLLSSVLALLACRLYLPKQISWPWFHSLIALMSVIVLLPYSVLNFTVALVVIFVTVPLVLIKPPVSKFDYLRNIVLLLLCSPVIPLALISIAFEIPVPTLLYSFVENISANIHHIYPLVFFLYLPNYTAAIIATFFIKPIHAKTE